MSKIFHWRIYCITDSKWEYVWQNESDGELTQCPTDSRHDAGPSSVFEELEEYEPVVDTATGNTVKAEQRAPSVDGRTLTRTKL